jgi:hypothetical protein
MWKTLQGIRTTSAAHRARRRLAIAPFPFKIINGNVDNLNFYGQGGGGSTPMSPLIITVWEKNWPRLTFVKHGRKRVGTRRIHQKDEALREFYKFRHADVHMHITLWTHDQWS